MQINKLIITTEGKIADKIIARFKLEEKHSDATSRLYFGKNIITDESENILLLSAETSDISSGMNHILEHFLIEKVFLMGYGFSYVNTDISEGDVVLPNTFIKDASEDKTIFLEYAVGQNYDLKQYGLVLNGICYSSNENGEEINDFLTENGIDVHDRESYSLLSNIKENKLDDKTVSLKGIISEPSETTISTNNLVQILELVL